MSNINWPGLLAWSTQYHDGTKPSEFSVMSAEDRDFLTKAMEDAFSQIEDPNQVMLEAIRQCQAPDRTSESILTALEVLDRCCDDPDCARNVEKLGGTQVLLDLLGVEPSGDPDDLRPDGAAPPAGPGAHAIRLRVLEILALLCANNLNIQQAAAGRGAVGTFTRIVQDAPAGSEEKVKGFRALAALVRGVPELEVAFLEAGGAAVLLAMLDPAEEARAHEKAASLVVTLAHDRRVCGEDAVRLAAALAPVVEAAGGAGLQHRETVATCARELAAAMAPLAPSPELLAAVQARLEELRAAGADPEGGEELGILLETRAALTPMA